MNWPFKKKEIETAANQSALARLTTHNCDREEFVRLYTKLIQERIPNATIRAVEAMTIHLQLPNGPETTNLLENVWRIYQAGQEDRRDLIERSVRMVQANLQPAKPIDKNCIIPIIKDTTYVNLTGNPPEIMCEPLAGDIWIVYAEDLPDSTMAIAKSRFAALGIDEKELRTLAVQNLRRILPDIEQNGNGPLVMLSAVGDYTASLLLLDDLWDQMAVLVDGPIVAVTPARDVLFFTGANSTDVIEALQAHAKDIVANGDHVISATLLVRSEQTWAVFQPT